MTPALAAAVASNARTRRVLADLRAPARIPVPQLAPMEPAFEPTTCAACGVGIRNRGERFGRHRTIALCFHCWFVECRDASDYEGNGQ